MQFVGRRTSLRVALVALVHTALIPSSTYVAYLLRFDGNVPPDLWPCFFRRCHGCWRFVAWCSFPSAFTAACGDTQVSGISRASSWRCSRAACCCICLVYRELGPGLYPRSDRHHRLARCWSAFSAACVCCRRMVPYCSPITPRPTRADHRGRRRRRHDRARDAEGRRISARRLHRRRSRRSSGGRSTASRCWAHGPTCRVSSRPPVPRGARGDSSASPATVRSFVHLLEGSRCRSRPCPASGAGERQGRRQADPAVGDRGPAAAQPGRTEHRGCSPAGQGQAGARHRRGRVDRLRAVPADCGVRAVAILILYERYENSLYAIANDLADAARARRAHGDRRRD